MVRVFEITAKIWIYDGPAAWHFVTITKETSKKIKHIPILRRGWGSVPVNVTIGKTSWKTSIFPDKDDVYLLPIKKEIRRKENLKEGAYIKLKIEIIEDFLT
ncbi:MAG: DUF1905 domain-containing protein [Microgenomates group bacterium]